MSVGQQGVRLIAADEVGVEVGVARRRLDAVQQAAVDFAAAGRPLADPSALLVLGAPGTGKSVLAVEAVAGAVAAGSTADRCLVLAPTRTLAATLRDRVATRLRGTSTEPVARTLQAFAWGILRQEAALRGDPPPRLLSGPEQDVVLRELLAGHAAGDPIGPDWPESVRQALGTRGFRAELRDLLMRAVESALTPDELARLGIDHDRPEWVAAAQVLDEYDRVTALSAPGGYDPSWILGAATDLLLTDPEAAERLHTRRDLIVVDDAQDLSPAGARLLRAAAGPGCRVLLIADPDATVQGFRGGDPAVALDLASGWGAGEALILATSYRQGGALRAVSARVAARIGALGGGRHRAPTADPQLTGTAEVALYRSVAAEAAAIAGRLRRAHLLEGVAWDAMAVIVRGQSRATALRRSLAVAGVPIATAAATIPLRDEPAVRPFLALLDLTCGTAPPAADLPGFVVDLVMSPVGQGDALALRRVRRALRSAELAAGGDRTSDELLVEAVLGTPEPPIDGPGAQPIHRVRRVLAAARSAGNAPAEDVLWAMWQASGLAGEWEREALRGGPAGARADRDLDAVVALFAAAATYQDRLPAAPAAGFAEQLRGQDVPGDRLVKAAPDAGQVALLTPQAAAGRSWPLVVVAGVQESVWPDLRLRGSLLGSQDLVDVVTGRGRTPQAAAAAVRYDETRQFLVAVSRASSRLVVTAVDNDEEQPSPFLELVDDRPATADRDYAAVRRPMSLAGIVAALRRDVAAGGGEASAGALAWLAELGVRGADPAAWWPVRERSESAMRRPEPLAVRVSPSALERFDTCALQWMLTTSGGERGSAPSASLGTLIHEIVEQHGEAGLAAMLTALDQRWAGLGLPDGWVSRAQREQAQLMLQRAEHYLQSARDAGSTLIGTEVPFAVRLGRADLNGRVDRLERTPGGVRVIDFKTGSSTPSQDDVAEHLQLGAYQAALADGGFAEVGPDEQLAGAALVQLGKAAGKTPKAKVQPQQVLAEHEDPRWPERRIGEIADGMADRQFLAVVGERCTICPVRSSCPLQDEGRML